MSTDKRNESIPFVHYNTVYRGQDLDQLRQPSTGKSMSKMCENTTDNDPVSKRKKHHFRQWWRTLLIPGRGW